MNTEIIVALLALAGTLIGSGGGVLVSSKLTNYRLQQLENRVAEHNNYARRMPVVEEQIKVINHRVADLEAHEERSKIGAKKPGGLSRPAKRILYLFYGAKFFDVVAVSLSNGFHGADGEFDFFHVVGHLVKLFKLFVDSLLGFKDERDVLFEGD